MSVYSRFFTPEGTAGMKRGLTVPFPGRQSREPGRRHASPVLSPNRTAALRGDNGDVHIADTLARM